MFGEGGTIRRSPNLLIPFEIRQEEQSVETEAPERQDQAYNLPPQRRPRYPLNEAEYEVYQLQIIEETIEENENNYAKENVAGTAENLESVAGSVILDERTSSASFRMTDDA